MLSFRLVNFVPPQQSTSLVLNTPCGGWTLDQTPAFSAAQSAIAVGQVAETYFLENTVSLSQGAAVADLVFAELTPILLGMTYLTGLSVTVMHSSPASEIQIVEPGDQWPRARALQHPTYAVTDDASLIASLGAFVHSWAGAGQQEKALLLVHHWIDALGCWSLEDLYLSTTTLMQVISATEADRQNTDLTFFAGLQGAATRAGVVAPNHDWVKMRNDLVHDGALSATKFKNKTKQDCCSIAAEALNWIDLYIDRALGLGINAVPRFKASDFLSLKTYSLS